MVVLMKLMDVANVKDIILRRIKMTTDEARIRSKKSIGK